MNFKSRCQSKLDLHSATLGNLSHITLPPPAGEETTSLQHRQTSFSSLHLLLAVLISVSIIADIICSASAFQMNELPTTT